VKSSQQLCDVKKYMPLRKYHHKILRGKFRFQVSLQTTLSAEAHLAEGQFFLEEQILNEEKSLICRAGTRRPTVP
jgi:hypothetical protein